MKVLFLCGGVGKRMFPLTEDKVLLKFYAGDSVTGAQCGNDKLVFFVGITS